MSSPALCQAVRDVIQAGLTINGSSPDANTCEVGFDGQPKPSAGQVYIAVHMGGFNRLEGDYDLDEGHDVYVTVTYRLGVAPKDRFGVEIWAKATSGLDALCRSIITLLHHNQNVRIYANHGKSYSIGDTGGGPDGFYTPLRFASAGKPQYRDYSWFTALPPKDLKESDYEKCGVSQELRFGKANRCQTISGMT